MYVCMYSGFLPLSTCEQQYLHCLAMVVASLHSYTLLKFSETAALFGDSIKNIIHTPTHTGKDACHAFVCFFHAFWPEVRYNQSLVISSALLTHCFSSVFLLGHRQHWARSLLLQLEMLSVEELQECCSVLNQPSTFFRTYPSSFSEVIAPTKSASVITKAPFTW